VSVITVLSLLIGALGGAILTGAFSVWDKFESRTHRAENILAALVAEVTALTSIIREQGYNSDIRATAKASNEEGWDGGLNQIGIQSNYLKIFDSLAPELGLIEPDKSKKIVDFYIRAKAFIDSNNLSDEYIETATIEEKKSHAIAASKNVEELLRVGDAIAQFDVATK